MMRLNTHLTTSMMPQVIPVDFKPAMVVHVNELMRDSTLHVLLAEECACTEYDSPWVGRKPAGLELLARRA